MAMVGHILTLLNFVPTASTKCFERIVIDAAAEILLQRCNLVDASLNSMRDSLSRGGFTTFAV